MLRRRKAIGRARLVMGAAAALTLLFGLWAAAGWPVGLPGEWTVHRARRPGAVTLWTICLSGAVVVALCAWAYARDAQARLAHPWAAAGVLQIAATAHFLAFALAGPYGVMELCTAMVVSGANGSYFAEAERIGPYPDASVRRPSTLPPYASVRAYLAAFAEDMPMGHFHDIRVRTATHPPGCAVALHGVHRVLRLHPALREMLRRTYRDWLPHGRHLFQDRVPPAGQLMTTAAVTMALLLVAVASAAVAGVLLAASLMQMGPGRWLAAGLTACSPALLIFGPGVDQAFAGLSAALVAAWLIAWRRERPAWGILPGLLISWATGFSLAFGVLAAVCALHAAIAWWARPSERARIAKRIAWFAAAGLAAWAPAWAAGGYDHMRVVLQCRANNALVQAGRTYVVWLGLTPLTWAMFLGSSATALLLASLPDCARPHNDRRALALALVGVLALLILSGQTRGEVERIWMFLVPVATLAAAAAGRSLVHTPSRVAGLLSLQAAQAVIFRLYFDVWATAP